jgi:hypothetical protein
MAQEGCFGPWQFLGIFILFEEGHKWFLPVQNVVQILAK